MELLTSLLMPAKPKFWPLYLFSHFDAKSVLAAMATTTIFKVKSPSRWELIIITHVKFCLNSCLLTTKFEKWPAKYNFLAFFPIYPTVPIHPILRYYKLLDDRMPVSPYPLQTRTLPQPVPQLTPTITNPYHILCRYVLILKWSVKRMTDNDGWQL